VIGILTIPDSLRQHHETLLEIIRRLLQGLIPANCISYSLSFVRFAELCKNDYLPI
jgi:hypothetical protein